MKFIKPITILLLFLIINAGYSQNEDCSISKLETRLIEMMHQEQSVRKDLMASVAQFQKDGTGGGELFSIQTKMNEIDKKNQDNLISVLEECGWPDNLADEAHKSIFLILQHSPDATMRKYYPMVKDRSESGIISSSDAATMFDRLQMRAGKPQQYGTQAFQHNGQNTIWPIKNIDSIDAIRESVGLPSMEVYFKIVKDSTGIEILWDKSLKIEDISRN